MRHRKHRSKLNRTSEHRLSLMRNLAIALIEHERIRTTQPKAAAVRSFLEKLVTLARKDTIAARRLAMARLVNRSAVCKLFEVLAPRTGDRPGGYLRIVKDQKRMGDGALMAFIEFVDDAPETDEIDAPETMEAKIKRKRHEARKARASA